MIKLDEYKDIHFYLVTNSDDTVIRAVLPNNTTIEFPPKVLIAGLHLYYNQYMDNRYDPERLERKDTWINGIRRLIGC